MQRRLAARRERERRRPSGERRYRFTTPEPSLEPSEEALEQDGEVEDAVEAPAARPARIMMAAAAPSPARSTAKPFSAYKDEYAYVYGDLRRVGAVIGGLLVALVILYFVLPILVH